MAGAISPNLVLLDFPAGSGELLAATARGTYLVVIWVSAATDLTARVQKKGPGAGSVLSVVYQPGTTAGLAWVAGALVATTAGATHRYASVLKT